jgi:hypothetical protein
MLSDGLTSLQAGGSAREEVEVLDVAQMLLASVQRPATPENISAEPDAGEVTQTANTVTDHRDVGALATASREPDPEKDYAEQPKPTEPTGPGVPAGDDDPAG